MEIPSPIPWPSELEMADSFLLDQINMYVIDEAAITEHIPAAITEHIPAAAVSPEDCQQYSSYSNGNTYCHQSLLPVTDSTNCTLSNSSETDVIERTTEPHMPHPYWGTNLQQISDYENSPAILSFDNANTNPQQSLGNSFDTKNNQEGNVLTSQDSSYVTQNHEDVAAKQSIHQRDNIMAERKRRAKLSQLFIALSAIIPGLKKLDKSSVLEETIKYIKELQEEVKKLEEQNAKSTKDTVFVKKSQVFFPDENSSSDEGSVEHGSELQLPEIEVRVSEKSVLLRIHCQRQSKIMEKTLVEIENFNLTIISTRTLPYWNGGLQITIVAEMDDGFCISAGQLVKKLLPTFASIAVSI
ncbi:Transcription factor bHLH25 like [Quillaja saponaria]|uniref:Transcription factor bHLH25 like n=1 Tax=Quillaja saponaria TaxID=32244 RepID=A0AAD7L7Q4_QUISA|nr:Transcription factor bHLH25 like [Quillaja saponaria]